MSETEVTARSEHFIQIPYAQSLFGLTRDMPLRISFGITECDDGDPVFSLISCIAKDGSIQYDYAHLLEEDESEWPAFIWKSIKANQKHWDIEEYWWRMGDAIG